MGVAKFLLARQKQLAESDGRAANIEGGRTVQIIRDKLMLRKAISARRAAGDSIALVPTMGALHEGHLSLVRAAKQQAGAVVASIFVNPAQFGPNEDFTAYPRDEERDAAMLAEEGTALLWAPDVTAVYPPGYSTHVSVAELGSDYCGAARPGHFDGVATIVSKLFNQVRPDIAVFGEKDWQQLAIIRRMTRDLDFDLEILGVPIARARDGLALSSRNAYLSPQQRSTAVCFPTALRKAAAAIAKGNAVAQSLSDAKAAILNGGFDSIDYVALADADSLERLDIFRKPARLLASARIGKTRLIDNWPVG